MSTTPHSRSDTISPQTAELIDKPEQDLNPLSKKPKKPMSLAEQRRLIENEFDLEILLKHRELNLVDEEINKVEAQMIALRNHYNIPVEGKLEREPKDFTEKYLNLLSKYKNEAQERSTNQEAQYTSSPSEFSYRTRSQTSSLRPIGSKFLASSGKCIYRRSDGVLVQLTCKNCERTNFSSAQGFLNHCRIAHNQEFTSQDNAALICGETLPDEEQDKEGLDTVMELRKQNLDPSKNLAKPQLIFTGDSKGDVRAHSATSTSSPPLTERPSSAPRKLSSPSAGSNVTRIKSTQHLKHKFKNNPEFEALLKDTTSEVLRSHLLDDEEEDINANQNLTDENKNLLKEAKRMNLKLSKPINVERPRSSSSSAGANSQRHRRKSRGGVGLRKREASPGEQEDLPKLRLKLNVNPATPSPSEDTDTSNTTKVKAEDTIPQPNVEPKRPGHMRTRSKVNLAESPGI
ncbi:BA75_01773T0 [Komagataella pastoris]|uniref:BA75_01773T0 n=1 Tax=Komagataella pastoris TaxID=4922 RepID=A0A1B2J5W8_PICPA|nr:BA75_01773T0 [Komagataella pastoris]